VAELIGGLRDHAEQVTGGRAVLAAARLPQRIHRLAQRRLDALSGQARHLLMTAALLGPAFRLEDLGRGGGPQRGPGPRPADDGGAWPESWRRDDAGCLGMTILKSSAEIWSSVDPGSFRGQVTNGRNRTVRLDDARSRAAHAGSRVCTRGGLTEKEDAMGDLTTIVASV
jgi:hypothetical protein